MNTLSATILSLPILLITTASQALSLKYIAHDAQGNPATSEITVLDESNGVYFVEITGGMPRPDGLGGVYIDTHFGPTIEQPDSVLGYAVYRPPELYLFTNSQMLVQMVYFSSQNLYVFRFDPNTGFTLTTSYAHAYIPEGQRQYETTFPESAVYELIE